VSGFTSAFAPHRWSALAPALRAAFGLLLDADQLAAFAALADPKIKAQLADLGATALSLSPADFGKLIAEETEKWGKVIRAANIKPE
jgi:hypothetical protein